ncbi:hypothetical protein AB1Y20_003302 [Prymnesium parvum]|uniref:CBM1 domain-containing protein n=1 Tax=Prymnesium parvum TaxID=97485 RepID=A0AB34JBH3_PRYPA
MIAMMLAVTTTPCPTASFGQCAGVDSVTHKPIDAAHMCCPADFRCIKATDFYSQCLPVHVPPFSPPFKPPSPPAAPPPPPSPPKSPPPPPSPPRSPTGSCGTPKYAQCAGRGIESELCCPSGFTCHQQSDFYSQCVPVVATEVLATASCETKPFGQCAGVDSVTHKPIDAAHMCCPADFRCIKATDFYSQCLPVHVPPFSPPFKPPSPPAAPPPPPSPPKSPPPPPSPPRSPTGSCGTPKYAQCAGRGIESELCCPSGFTCHQQSDFYSQCVPVVATEVLATASCETKPFGQCAGVDSVTHKPIDAAHMCCPSDFRCTKATDFYSQCLPVHVPPFSPPFKPPSPPAAPPPPPSPPKSPPPPPSPPRSPTGSCGTPKYAQCAGRGIESELCCPSGFTCHQQSDFYSQCVPVVATEVLATASCETKPFGQCAGVDSVTHKPIDAAHMCCPADFRCTKATDFYSQCLPVHVPPFSPPFKPPSPPAAPPPPPSPPKSPPPPPSPPRSPTGSCGTPKYAQCAGRGIESELCCPSGFTCHQQSDFYSQCLPKSAPSWAANVFHELTSLLKPSLS